MQISEPQFSSTNQDLQVRQKCELAKQLENAGDYEEARISLAGFWNDIGGRPAVADLDPATKGELLLRAGSLTGWLGSVQQVPQAQEIAKDLIAESARIFASLGQHEKAVEAQTDLAICYWRAGALDEAAVWFEEAFSRASSVENRVRILINRAIVEIFSNNIEAALGHLSQATPLLEQVNDHATHGRYHMQRALAFKRLGGRDNLDRALIENAAASFHLEQARHTRYLARVENNIAGILMELERFDEALEHLSKARQIFTELKDDGSVAQVNESLARVFLAQQCSVEAEQAAAAAVAILEHGDEQVLLSEALTTRGIALSQMERYQDAFEIFRRATQVAEVAGNLLSSGRTRLIMVEQLRHYLAPEDLFTLYQEADERIGRAPDSNTVERLRSAAKIAVAAAQSSIGKTIEEMLGNSSLKEEVRRYEGELIKRALESTDGQVTGAARMLRITHQGLCEMLKTRHKSLRIRPPRVRQRS